jgi:hypothetical protein
MGTKIPTGPAAIFLTENGKPTKEATLNSLRSTGAGPPFYKGKGKSVLYDTDDLLDYIKADPTQKYTSTSQYSTRKKKTRPHREGENHG